MMHQYNWLVYLVTVSCIFLSTHASDDALGNEDRVKRTGLTYVYQYANNVRRCTEPGTPQFGFSYFHSTHAGAVVVHKCKPGYRLTGAKLRVCKQTGNWYPRIPKCIFLSRSTTCKRPASLSNGIVLISSTHVNSIVKYKCHHGYQLAGSNYQVCRSNGQWTGTFPNCVALGCKALSSPANGNVQITSTRIGAVATYSCNDGFQLVGNKKRVCRPKGQWSGVDPSCQELSCGTLANPQNGHVKFSSTNIGTTAQYSCNTGFLLVGSNTRTCQSNRNWSGMAPVCRPLSCGRLDSPQNGKAIISGTTPGSLATYSCNAGFTLMGQYKRTCQVSGKWSGKEPACKPIKCQNISPPLNGIIEFSSSSVETQKPGDKAIYSCSEGFHLIVGTRIRVCQQNGIYSGTAPSCKSVSCGNLRDPPNGRVELTGKVAGDRATYTCNRGFILQGKEIRICQKSGAWNGQESLCKPVDCGALFDPRNGRVTITTSRLGGIAKYSCNDGFDLVGTVIRRCLASGEWSREAPFCKVNSCGNLIDPPNGRVRLTGTTLDSLAIYLCNRGFQLVGTRRRVCQRDTTWSGEEPHCKPIICEVLQDPINGRVAISGGTFPGSVATYNCNPGFQLVGSRTRVCSQNGLYANIAPTCQRITCAELDNPTNGQVEVNGQNPGAEATYSCNPGFVLLGQMTRLCQIDGSFSGQTPVCKSIICEHLPAIENGQVTVSDNRPGSVATYTCNPGFSLIGRKNRICKIDGTFSGQDPRCEKIDCGILGDIQNGRVEFTSTTISSIANYICDKGYNLIGKGQRICQQSGQWSGVEPTCKIVDCGLLTPPQNGDIDFTSTTFLSKTSYSCRNGFQLVGTKTRICQDNGQWTSTAPTCQLIDCEQLESPTDGIVIVSGNTVRAVATYSCNPGFELIGVKKRICQIDGRYSGIEPFCRVVNCDILDDPNNGIVKFDRSVPGSLATYACHKGFSLVGVSTRVCQQTGKWSKEEPTCKIISCEVLLPVVNGEVIFPSTEYGAVATYSCNFGFILTGVITRTCELEGKWSGSTPFCQSIQCGLLVAPTNGNVDVAGTIVGSRASYSCHPGFRLIGREVRTCQESEEWSGQAPICQSIDCGAISDPEYGTVTITGTTTGSLATYKCNKGFKLMGAITRVCLNSGDWSREAPVCEPEDCGPLKDPKNGKVDASGTAFWDTATYNCDPGYEIVGEAVRSCQDNGQWSGVAPFCRSVSCGLLDSPKNGRVSFTGITINSVAKYSCFQGYDVVGETTRTCQKNGQWSGHEPFCKAVNCGQLSDPENGKVTLTGTDVFSMATYNCNQGFGLLGVSSRICQDSGSWSDSAPTCEPSDCGQLVSPANGMVKTSGTKFWDTATYSCMGGYRLIGKDSRTCEDTGLWIGEAPICVAIDCRELKSPENGRVLFSSTTFRSEVNYLCDKAFQLVGDRTRICQANGQWSGEAPFCQSVTCTNLIVPSNGQLELGQGNLAGSTAHYTCNHGYQLQGNKERKCQSTGQWTGSDPTCSAIDCGDLFDVFNGHVLLTGTTVTSVATYSCNIGFELIGKSTRECLGTGQWSGKDPQCKPGGCQSLDHPLNGNVEVSGTDVGDTATYSCQDGFKLTGTSFRVCEINGRWSDTAPTCAPSSCDPLENPQNGRVTFDGTSVGSSATYVCNIGFILNGNERRQCLRTGEWTGTDPTCKVVDCGPLSPPINGDIRVTITTFASSARYSCSAGFNLVGLEFRVCQVNGRWTGKAPTCRVNQCSVLPKPLNGIVAITGTSFGSMAMYTCNRGFELVGEDKRVCNNDASWTGKEPLCKAIDCGSLGAPEYGRVSFTTTNFGSVAIYSCDETFVLGGTRRRTCQENGAWSGIEPTCKTKIVNCGTLPNPVNGQVLLSGTNSGDTATFTCFVGFTIVGNDLRYCRDDGIWSGSEPRCRSLDCGRLIPPNNGDIKYIGTGFGAVARYSCFPEYKLVGDVSRTCRSNGDWSGQSAICVLVSPTSPPLPSLGCGDPGTPANGRKVGESYTVGSVVYYECDTGFRLDGPQSRLCRFDGLWSDSLPSCVGSGQCVGTKKAEDGCGQLCSCENGYLTNCCRLRHDYASYNDKEKERYIYAVITVTEDPVYKIKYAKLLQKYQSSFGTAAQSSVSARSQFFVWNRFFLIEYENLLREIDCHITIPYYDWTILHTNPYIHPVYDDKTGFGKSSRDSDNCMSTGPFNYEKFSLITSAGGGCLKREYTNRKFPSRALLERDVLTRPGSEFTEFQRSLQLFIHTNVRCYIGGTMCTKDAANDPLFVLHLAMLDYLYSRWQSFDEGRLKARYSTDTSALVLSENLFTVSQFHDNSNLPNGLAVCYAEPRVKNHVPPGLYFLARSFAEGSDSRENFYMTCVSGEKFAESGQQISNEEEKAFIEQKCSHN